MDFTEVVIKRRSVRKYQDKPVNDAQIAAVLEAARLAPSWKNMQCWKFIVVRSEVGKEKVMSSFDDANPGKKAIRMAPVIIILCADPNASGIEYGKHYYLVDSGIVMEHLILEATNLGLATCWLGLFNEAVIKKEFNIDEKWVVVAITPLGYAAYDPKPRPRKTLDEIVFEEVWGNTKTF